MKIAYLGKLAQALGRDERAALVEAQREDPGVFKGKKMDQGYTLKKTGVVRGETLNMIIALKGGGGRGEEEDGREGRRRKV